VAGLRTTPGGAPGADLGFSPAPAPQRIGDLEAAMVADFVLGGALRARTSRERPLPTLSLSLELVRTPRAAAGFTAHATRAAVDGGVGTAAAVLCDGGTAVGHASATFAVPSRGRQPVLPWDDPDGVPVADPLPRADLDEVEAAALGPVAGGGAVSSLSWGDRVVEAGTATTAADGRATLRFRPTGAVANRAGAVQGAVLVALATRAARAAAGTAGQDTGTPGGLVEVRSVAVRFARAAHLSTVLQVVARVEHRTRRTVFVDVVLSQDGATRAAGGVVCRIPGT
jgi:acyl-coenzyme A thioesterase PaaI-like protein